MTPAEELRNAATKLRDTAAQATNGPWQIRSGNNVSSNVAQHDGTLVIDGGGWTDGERAVVYGAALHADAAWIALVNPEVAGPLADALDLAASAWEGCAARGDRRTDDSMGGRLLAAARAINAGAR